MALYSSIRDGPSGRNAEEDSREERHQIQEVRRERIIIWTSTALAIGLLSSVVPSSLLAQAPAAASKGDELAAKLSGKRIHLDSRTGQLRELTGDEARTLIDAVLTATDRSTVESRTPIQTANGQMFKLDDHTGHIVLTRWNDDRSLSTRCVESADEAVAFLSEEGLPVQ